MKKKGIAVYAAIMLLCTTSGCKGNSQISLSQTSLSFAETESDGHVKNGAEDIVLTLALTGNPEIQDVIDAFNAADNGYQVVIKRYHENVDENGFPITYDNEDKQYADLEILQDIINTDTIDIICSESFSDGTYYTLLEKKGAYADLYTFMQQDAQVNCSTLNQHILDLMETDGHLYSLMPFYGVKTLIGEEKYVGMEENWTVEDFISRWNTMPDNATIDGSRNSENSYYVLLRANLSQYIDYKNAEVHFDSPEFRRILEFCNTFESNHGLKGEYDYDAPRFVQQYEMFGFKQAALFSDETYTLVGFPTEDRSGAFLVPGFDGCYSINAMASPEKQAGAWQFIRTFAEYEYQMTHDIEVYNDDPEFPEYGTERGFPLNTQAYADMSEAIAAGTYSAKTYQDKGEIYDVILPTMKDCERVTTYIESIRRLENSYGVGALWDIINDEVMLYFAGEKSIEDTIRMIQSRASLWIAEQS